MLGYGFCRLDTCRGSVVLQLANKVAGAFCTCGCLKPCVPCRVVAQPTPARQLAVTMLACLVASPGRGLFEMFHDTRARRLLFLCVMCRQDDVVG